MEHMHTQPPFEKELVLVWKAIETQDWFWGRPGHRLIKLQDYLRRTVSQLKTTTND